MRVKQVQLYIIYQVCNIYIYHVYNIMHIPGVYISSGVSRETQRKTNLWIRDKVGVKEKGLLCFIKRRKLAIVRAVSKIIAT